MTVAQYQLTSATLDDSRQVIIRQSDGANIPPDPLNADFQQYLAWIADGNTPTPYAPPPVVPSLTFLQFMALFTPGEQAAIVNSADTQTKLFMLMATGAGLMPLNNPEVVAGVNYLATPPTASPPGPGLIAPSRVAQILAGQAVG